MNPRTSLCVAVLVGCVLTASVAHGARNRDDASGRLVPDRDTYVVEITADAAAILARLEAAARQPRSGPLPRTSTEQRIEALQQEFLSRAHLSFDGQAARPRFQYDQEPVIASPESALTPPGAMIRLSGAIPADARSLAWRYA